MTKAAAYLRQSVDKKDDKLAIDRQRQDCIKLCKRRGWTPVEYVDNDTSASTSRRPGYQDMLADIESGAIGAVVVWHVDRLHRRPIELEEFISLADAKGIALATVTGVRR
jgi:DNA invertase Pin-like site-specific DNA recombinase